MEAGGRSWTVVLQFLMVHLVIETIFLIIDLSLTCYQGLFFLDSGNMEIEVYRTGGDAGPAVSFLHL